MGRFARNMMARVSGSSVTLTMLVICRIGQGICGGLYIDAATVHLDTYTVDGAWDLQDRYPLSYWDALIVSSAHQQGCGFLLSEDLQHGQQIDAVRVLNPFESTPKDLPAE